MGEYRNGMKMKLMQRTASMQLEMYRCGPKNSVISAEHKLQETFARARGTHLLEGR